MKPAVRAALAASALGVSLGAAFLVLRGETSNWIAAGWAVSIPLFAVAARDRTQPEPGGRRLRGPLLVFAAAALPVLVRVANMDSERLHGDEFLTGYFSATHDFAHRTFFGYMPEKWEWQGQFPKIYFFLQRIVLDLLGANTLALRLSIQVYVAIIGACVFLIAREILGTAAALIAVFFYSFLAASVYLETLALFFVGATAAFCLFFYFALRQYRTGRTVHAALAGIAGGFCYLMYYSSYLAFPLLAAFAAIQWLRFRRAWPLLNFAVSLGGMLLVLAPFLAFIRRSGNYAVRRVEDISLLGSMSPLAGTAGGTSPLAPLGKNLALAVRSLYRDGIAGAGGFEFGNLSILDPLSVALLAAGLLFGIVLVFRKREILFVLIVLVGCLAMVALAAPPPTTHRFSLAYPFAAIVMALPLGLLLQMRAVPGPIRGAIAGGLLLLFASVNESRLADAVLRDPKPVEFQLSEFLNQRYGPRRLSVAAFDAFFFEKLFYFRDRWKGLRKVETGFHHHLLDRFDKNEKYVYVMILGDDFRKEFERADPAGRYFKFSIGYSIFAN